MYTKPEIIEAIKLAIEDHKAYAGRPSDWAFIDKLVEARKIVEASPEREPIVRFGSDGKPVYYPSVHG